MHSRNIYIVEPDFKKLAEEFEAFKPFVKTTSQGRSFIDFKDPKAVKQLCVCLMRKDFNIDIDFPLDTLCPAVPNRLNYILWLEDLLNDTLTLGEKKNEIRGIDIGVGASCIYPLLGCAQNQNWTFLGTEIDARSVEYALKNIKSNNLQDRISIKYNEDPNKIFLIEDNQIHYAFSMCNPPFYSSQEEVDEGLTNKQSKPYAVCTGSENEMITQGGELSFIKTMIDESLHLKKRIRWYTSMIGLKSTIRPLIRYLTAKGISNHFVTSFTQGKTTRWGIAWSFYTDRPITAYMVEEYSTLNKFEIELPKKRDDILEDTIAILKDLEIEYECPSSTGKDNETILRCCVDRNTWSRAARRQRKRQKLDRDTTDSQDKNIFDEPVIFQIQIRSSSTAAINSTVFYIVWTSGQDREIFISLWSHLKKRIEEQCGFKRGTHYKN
ncbi:hypothetical protein BDF20DRAFT_916102 [Mycotypha africana]|uniref:uncharacterized protein n=1 Tax=Mycotypha africana TaxID=64632 RepID=UPI002300CEF4|nr:uncharacterized protein BDF20DRAFT_916102 [Mycotypha africana]KAI8970275.1 hypothetical protein BDF20DRAFT_916102 [Mycotypha africana]